MGRPLNSLNVTEAERERIRELYRQGLRLTEICRRTGRCDSVVSRAVRGLKRPKPARQRRVTQRNALIARRVLDEGVPQAVMARRFKLTATSICLIVKAARKERRRRRSGRPASRRGRQSSGARSTSRRRGDWVPASKPALTRQQAQARNRHIRWLVLERKVAVAIVARRYDLSPGTVRRLVDDPARSRPR